MSRRAVLAFVVAFVTLFVQVLIHRLVSVKLVSNFAFFVISLTMLGFAVSGILLTGRLDRLLQRLDDVLVVSAACFSFSLLLASALFCRAPLAESWLRAAWATSRTTLLATVAYALPLALLFAVPFVFCGVMLGLLLSAPRVDARRVYGFDLAGSALGAMAVIPASSALGAEKGLLAASALLVGASWALASPRGRATRVLAMAALAGVALAWAGSSRVFAMRYTPHSWLDAAQDPGSGVVLEDVDWDPVARVETFRIEPPDPRALPWPSLVGSNPRFTARYRRVFTQNNTAFTYAPAYAGGDDPLTGIEETIYAAAYSAISEPNPAVLVIGVGGGLDLMSALHAGAREVVGVEVNGAMLRAVRENLAEYSRGWVRDPRVRLVHDEGRAYLERSRRSFDVIQLSGVDSAAGTAAAAHVFSENYLYTAEAFDALLAHLSRDGVLCMMRTEYAPPREMLRALVTALGALRRAGAANPASHVLVAGSSDGLLVALLVKRTPFTREERGRFSAWAGGSAWLRLLASEETNGRRSNVFELVLSLDRPQWLAEFVRRYPFDIRPSTDDRPFFFRHSYWWHLFSSAPVVRSSVPVMELMLIALVFLLGGAVTACVYLPLRVFSSAGLAGPQAGRWGVFFGSIGLGYLFVEMALLQRFGLFLGHPNLSLSVVLGSLLLATGVGALVSRRALAVLGQPRYATYLLAAAVLVEDLLVFPHLGRLTHLPFGLRVAVVSALVAPIGMILGFFFPTGLERIKSRASGFVPWAWGLNGIFSVVAPVLGVAAAMTWGGRALLLGAIPFYLAAAATFPEPWPARAGVAGAAGPPH